MADMRLSALEREYAMVHAAGQRKSNEATTDTHVTEHIIDENPDEQDDHDFDVVPASDAEIKSDQPSEWAVKPLAEEEVNEIKKIASTFKLAPPAGGFPPGMVMPAWAKLAVDSVDGSTSSKGAMGTAGKAKKKKKKKKKGTKSNGEPPVKVASGEATGNTVGGAGVAADWYCKTAYPPLPCRPASLALVAAVLFACFCLHQIFSLYFTALLPCTPFTVVLAGTLLH
jgi:hypothetical protein